MRSKMLLTYNIPPQYQAEYLQFMVTVFVPTLQKLGLENMGVWHTAYGDYPLRLLVFAADDKDMQEAIKGSEWQDMESRLKGYLTDYTCRIVPFTNGFQF